MAAKILVLTPQSAFGELIRQSLEQAGRYQVQVSLTANSAMAQAQKNLFDLAILDSDLGARVIQRTGQALMDRHPPIKLVAISPANPQDQSIIEELHPQAYLAKPFYLPDLIASLEAILSGPPTAEPVRSEPRPDEDSLAQTKPLIRTGRPAVTAPPAVMIEVTHDRESDAELAPPPEEDLAPRPADQWLVAASWFKENEGKTVPLMGLSPQADSGQPGDTTPIRIHMPQSATHLEPLPSILTKPVYASALVPRIAQHYLTGELAERLGQWVPQLCLALGWSLESLRVRPDYMEWALRLPPTLSPGKMLRIIRERTSERVFLAYQKLRDENPSGNFWAPGFLIVSGVHTLPLPALRKYIIEMRQRQGV